MRLCAQSSAVECCQQVKAFFEAIIYLFKVLWVWVISNMFDYFQLVVLSEAFWLWSLQVAFALRCERTVQWSDGWPVVWNIFSSLHVVCFKFWIAYKRQHASLQCYCQAICSPYDWWGWSVLRRICSEWGGLWQESGCLGRRCLF